MASEQSPAGISWHALSPRESLERLETDEAGLSEAQAKARRERYGRNELPREDRTGLLRIVLRQLADPLIYILLVAALVSLAIGSFNNAAFILAVLVLNTTIGAFQEYRSESSAAALRSAVRVRTRVRRDGSDREVDSIDLVPGDIVVVETGMSVPADIRLLSSDGLRADESALTGESLPAQKSADAAVEEKASVGERQTMLHAGSAVVEGRGLGVVCRIGRASEIGKIAQSLAHGEAGDPPLVIRMRRFTRRIAVLILAAVVLLAAVQLLRGSDLVTVFQLAVALSVSAIPAGLPVAITVAMSIASNRMAARNVIVRQLQAVEGLGACTLIASDKTGTLTANVLTVKQIWLSRDLFLEVGGRGYELEGDVRPAGGGHGDDGLADASLEGLRTLAETGVLCNEGRLRVEEGEPEFQGDATDVAFLVLGRKLGLEQGTLLEATPQVDSIPFDAGRRYAATFHEGAEGEVFACVKGAAEVVAGMCRDLDAQRLEDVEQHLGERGFRVLALARGRVQNGGRCDESSLQDLELLGLAALVDPVRPDVPKAIERCRSAGVEVRMITGDHAGTGLAIARELGIADDPEEVVSGRELAELEDDSDARSRRIREARVFARVEPAQKTDIVNSLQQGGHFVAVTGDGVNDAPALKAAHIGMAMGRGGTDVAKGAASLILSDDNFASIVNGIEEGRGVYDNVRKVTWLLLATSAGEVLLFFLAIFSGLPLPLTPVQLLWLNLVTNGIQDVALAFEKTEPDVLKRPPRPPDEPVFDRRMIRQTLISGAWIGTVAYALYFYLTGRGMGTDEARNLLLLLMVLFENVHTFSCRSESASVFSVPVRANPGLVGAVLLAQAIHIGVMFVPGLRDVLGMAPVSPAAWGQLLLLAATLLVVDEVAKWWFERRGRG